MADTCTAVVVMLLLVSKFGNSSQDGKIVSVLNYTHTYHQKIGAEAISCSINSFNSNTSFCPWFYCRNRHCNCGSIFEPPGDILYCNKNGTMSILDRHCVTYHEDADYTVEDAVIEVGSCIFNLNGDQF